MPYCSKCGSAFPEQAQFCPACGAPVKIQISPSVSPPTQTKTVSSSFFDRMIRAARLDASLYEEVEADNAATTQALIVVILSSICSGIGTGIDRALGGHGLWGTGTGLFGGLFSALIGWFTWSFITYFIGTRIFGGDASFSELLRTIGFSDAPGVILIFSFIPVVGELLSFIVWIWGLVAMVIAVRQALDFSTGKAVLTCIVGWIAALLLIGIISIFLAIPSLLI